MSAASVAPSASEFRMSDRAFAKVQELVRQRAGIALASGKRSLVYGRLARRLRALSLGDFDEYLALVEDPRSAESERFLNALTTNVTEFFREAHHFAHLAQQVVPASARGRRLRIWSAGCSTGEEPYSIAMTLRDAGVDPAHWDVKILATDIDSEVLSIAARGVYAAARVEKIAIDGLRKFFLQGRGQTAGQVRVKADLQKLVTFRQLNLLHHWPFGGPFDAVFCRNVIIYFEPETRAELVRRFAQMLTPGGRLFLGHSESLVGGASPLLEACGRTVYRRK